jgi:hypothetical protein
VKELAVRAGLLLPRKDIGVDESPARARQYDSSAPRTGLDQTLFRENLGGLTDDRSADPELATELELLWEARVPVAGLR